MLSPHMLSKQDRTAHGKTNEKIGNDRIDERSLIGPGQCPCGSIVSDKVHVYCRICHLKKPRQQKRDSEANQNAEWLSFCQRLIIILSHTFRFLSVVLHL